ncbi:alpha-amylase family protein [Nocardioides korecus]
MSPRDPGLTVLADLPEHRRHLLERRLERWLPDLDEALALLYPDTGPVRERLVDLACRAFADRSEELHDLDLRRSLAPDWFQRPETIGYAAYAERFAGDLRAVADRSAYLQELGVRYLHLMPLLTPREGPDDGGYAVADHRTVRADLGTTEDLRALTATLRSCGISLCLDLVLNHVAREHEWARRARAGEAAYRDYFLVFGDRELPDAYEATMPEVFPDLAPGSFTHDEELDGWVWTTFNHFQWDVNFANPAVLVEYADLVLTLANHGVEVLRLDAIAFTWKRLGTTSQNQPEVHALTQALRTVARIAAPALLLKAEAIVGPQDLLAYLGQGRHHGKVSDLAYHNSLMVQTWSMLASRDVRLATRALQQLGTPPSTTAWITYVRCHDDIGWAIDDADAAAVGLDGPAHRAFLSDFYSGAFPGSWARGLVFGENPRTGDRRISGTTAALAGLEAGDPHGAARVRLAHAVALGFGGLPVLWSGDELGMGNDPDWAAEPGHAEDNRWAHRPRLPRPLPPDTHGVGADLRHLLGVRRTLPHLHASVPAEVLDPRDDGVLLVARRHPLGAFLMACNVTDREAHVPGEVLRSLGLDLADVVDHLTGESPAYGQTWQYAVSLAPYQTAWLTARG